MICIDTYISTIQLKLIKQLLFEENAEQTWKIIPKYFLDKIGDNFLIFKMNIDNINTIEKNIIKQIPEFYLQLIKTWIKAKEKTIQKPTMFWEIRKQEPVSLT